ncbi:MAG: TetR/AcrR family transcriptional regulator [Achromobacter sp.]|jgi:AcrR family transcriptional regulator|uniref:TetR/AcrR family transcriptional regulator n=1 Tax=Achromobacter sp. TaxID=134375 RepID=UPI00258D3FAE|nr:TetR/AcrR family transcriptional regulator [Achromobacter sp.]MCW0208085.1 TetR/AcrR family transcriptional regulator [Achromobacter sp.]
MAKRRTEEVFLKELTALLIVEGVSSLTIADIAQRMQCSRRRIYEIAATKEELFVNICRQVLDANLEKGFAAARGEADGAKAIATYLRATLNASGLSKAALTDLDSTESGRAVFDAYQLARVRGLEDMIDDGVRQGLLVPHNPRVISEAILGAAHRLRNQRFLEETGLSIGAAFTEFYEIVLNGLLVKPQAGVPAVGAAARPRR